MKVFNPYKNFAVSHGLASIRQTAAATEKKDLFKRERFGDVIEIYSLRSPSS